MWQRLPATTSASKFGLIADVSARSLVLHYADMLQFPIDSSWAWTENKQGAGWAVEAHLQFQTWTTEQWTPSGILHRCDLDLIKNLTSYPVQIKPELPRCSFCLYVTFGSEGAFANGAGEEKAQWKQGTATFTMKALQKHRVGLLLQSKKRSLWGNKSKIYVSKSLFWIQNIGFKS